MRNVAFLCFLLRFPKVLALLSNNLFFFAVHPLWILICEQSVFSFEVYSSETKFSGMSCKKKNKNSSMAKQV